MRSARTSPRSKQILFQVDLSRAKGKGLSHIGRTDLTLLITVRSNWSAYARSYAASCTMQSIGQSSTHLGVS